MAAKLKRAEREAMFIYWIETGNKAEVGRRFEHTRATVQRIAKSDNWQLRQKKLQNKTDDAIFKEISKKVVDASITDYQVSTGLLAHILELIAQEESGIKPSFGDAIRLMQVRADMTGGSTGRSGGVNLYQVLSDGSLSTLDEKELGQRLSGHGAFLSRKAVLSKAQAQSSN